MTINSFFYIILLNVYLICANPESIIGDLCLDEEINVEGECVLLKDCPSALDDIHKRKHPQVCGFKGLEPIVCCPIKQIGKIAEQKCLEYGRIVNKNRQLDKKSLTENTCGFKDSNELVIDYFGTEASVTEFPNMAALGYGSTKNIIWNCGGTLISEQFVLTAAHCIFHTTLGYVKFIRLGELDMSKTNDSNSIDFAVIWNRTHPDYLPPSKYNDIALLKIHHSVIFNEYIRPSCLHLPTDSASNSYYIAIGWGETENNTRGSDHLQKNFLQHHSQKLCNKTYASNSKRHLKDGINSDTQLCAASIYKPKDTCRLDKGSPLLIYHSQGYCMYSVIGINSFDKSCGLTGRPSVFTRISYYIDWIEQNVWP